MGNTLGIPMYGVPGVGYVNEDSLPEIDPTGLSDLAIWVDGEAGNVTTTGTPPMITAFNNRVVGGPAITEKSASNRAGLFTEDPIVLDNALPTTGPTKVPQTIPRAGFMNCFGSIYGLTLTDPRDSASWAQDIADPILPTNIGQSCVFGYHIHSGNDALGPQDKRLYIGTSGTGYFQFDGNGIYDVYSSGEHHFPNTARQTNDLMTDQWVVMAYEWDAGKFRWTENGVEIANNEPEQEATQVANLNLLELFDTTPYHVLYTTVIIWEAPHTLEQTNPIASALAANMGVSYNWTPL